MKVMKKKTRLRVLSLVMLLVMLVTSVPGTTLNAAETSEGPLLQVSDGATLETVAIGATIWTNKDYVFTSLPSALIGKTYVKGAYGGAGEVEVLRSGYVYVLTNAYKTTNSQAETLDGLNYTKLDIPGWKFCDFAQTYTGCVWVYEKYVEAGESLQLGTWSVVFASEEKLDLTTNDYMVSDSEMAVVESLSEQETKIMELGAQVFTKWPTKYTFHNIPYWMAGKKYILGDYDNGGTVKVTRSGVLYMLANNKDDRKTYFEELGFTKKSTLDFEPFGGGDQGGSWNQSGFALYEKQVTEGNEITWDKWAIPIFSGDLVLSDTLAVLEPDADTTKACKLEYRARLFNNRVFYETGGTPTPLLGKSFLYSSFDEGATGTVTKAGTLYIQVPVKTTNSYTVQAEVEAAGFTPTPYRIYRNNIRLGFCQRLYQKEVKVGDTIHFGKYNLVIYDTIAEEDYYVMPSLTTSAEIINNPGAEYSPDARNWQGCPSIAVTENGRLWATWFTGGKTELATGNCAVLIYSDDKGETWVDPAVAVVHPDIAAQVTKPQIWIIPDGYGEYSGKLWCTWTQHTGTGGFDGRMGTWGAICMNPDAEDPADFEWIKLGRLYEGRGSGKILVVKNEKGTNGEEWLTTSFNWMDDRYYSNVYSSLDGGMNWSFKGQAEVIGSTYNNSVLVERKDENGNNYLWMLSRQLEGRNMVESFSYDGGVTWTSSRPSQIMHPNVDIYMGRTSSGKLLMVNHYMTAPSTVRNNLTAFLSDDDGKTWNWSLLLDERSGVSYPSAVQDVVEGKDGTIYIVYDYDRFNTGQILMATITEEDIMAGSYISDDASQKILISSIGLKGPQVFDNLEKIDLSNKLTWASTSSYVSASAHAAFDGNVNTRWCASNNSFPQTLTVDLGEVQDVAKININFEQEGDWEYTLRISQDGKTWSDYDTNPDQRQKEYSHEKTAQARYVAIDITSGGSDANGGLCWASIWEMSVLDAKGTNLALNKPCKATTIVDGGGSAVAAFDNNYDTRYCASSSELPQQLMVDMGATYDIGAIYIYFEQKSNWDYKLETSLDGVNWSTYADPEVQRLIDVTETKDAEARYVRLTVEDATDGDWASVWEMEVYSYTEDGKTAKEVDEKIAAIGEVTLDREEAIQDARTAYNALNDNAKGYVTKLADLEAAESKLAELKEAAAVQAAKDAAAKVDEKIAAIGEVTLDSEKAIQEARAAYDALSDNAKEYVNKLDALKAAEKKLAELKASQTPSTGGSEITPGEDKQETGTQTGAQTGTQTGAQAGTQTGVQTGDSMNVVIYLATLCVVALGIIFIIRVRRKENR
ncbi:MAG: discoidin domain-containing protein [Tyzzerella sp.]|nr:discoidin domain-containing protein [Tyzzerella sp.]